MTDLPITKKQFYTCLVLILLLGGAIRLPGMQWLINQSPDQGFTLHPDENRFIQDTRRFHRQPYEGYVRGFTTHIYVLKVLAEKSFGQTPNLAMVGRIVSLIYGILTLGLVALIVTTMTSSRLLGLLTVAFLSVAPLHVINSHFGTTDSAATFYFYLSTFLAWYHVKRQSEPAFILFAAAVGISIAIKVSVSLLMPLALIIIFHQNKIQKLLLAALIIPGGFSLASFLNYTPWNFVTLLNYLQSEAIRVVNGNSPLENILVYSHRVFSCLGLAAALLMLIGLLVSAQNTATRLNGRFGKTAVFRSIMRVMKHPNAVFFSGFVVQLYLVMTTGLNVDRFILVFIPLLCFGAAIGFRWLIFREGRSRWAMAASLVLIFGYQIHNAIAVERLFANDIRYEAAAWLENNVLPGETVTAFLNYSRVGEEVPYIHTHLRPDDQKPSDYISTTSLEYYRWFYNDDVSKVYHAKGGQERMDFFRNLFAGRLNYAIIKDFRANKYSFEHYLIGKGILMSLDLNVPYRHIIFKKLSEGE